MLQRSTEARVVNASVAAVGNYTQAELSKIPSRGQRVTENLIVTSVTSVLGEILAGK